jgi:hypothetical protein
MSNKTLSATYRIIFYQITSCSGSDIKFIFLIVIKMGFMCHYDTLNVSL